MLKLRLATWRPGLAALLVALATGLGGAAGPALAAPAGASELRYFMEATIARGTALVCVGDKVLINVGIVRAQVSGGTVSSAEWVAGAKVTSAVADASIGTLDRATTYTGFSGLVLGTTTFTFLAQKAGSTNIHFEGHIHYRKGILEHFSMAQSNDLVSQGVAVTVQDCDYQVSVLSYWREPSRKDVASIYEARLTADAPGHYTGSSPVNWTLTEGQAVNGCPFHGVTSIGTADLTAQLDTINQKLVVVITYQVSPLVWYTYRSDDCTQGSEIDTSLSAAKLNFNIGTYGGTGPLPQTVSVPGYGITNGNANVSVARVARP